MLKRKIAKLEDVKEEFRSLYKEDGAGGFVLMIEGDDQEDAGALKRAKDHEKEARKAAEKEAKELRDKLDEITAGAARKTGDIEALEKSWGEKLSKREAELLKEIEGRDGHLNKLLVDNVAQSLAAKLSVSPAVIMPHIKSRLQAEFKEGAGVTRVLDATGKPSAMTLDELEAEFRGNKDFAPIIIASKASGSGALGSGGGGAQGSNIDYTKASPKEIVEHIKSTKQ